MPSTKDIDLTQELICELNQLSLSESPSNLPIRKQELKDRLLLGEADYSFAVAFVNKRGNNQSACKNIIATEKLSATEVHEIYGKEYIKNLKALRAAGVKVCYRTDATQLHQYSLFKGKRYQSIHFNFPHDRSNFKDRTLPKLLVDFFSSAKQLQKPGDRIHMALPRQEDINRRNFYESYVYEIFKAASSSGYNLIQARPFSKVQYPGYEHKVTQSTDTHPIAEQAAEYIFEFTGLSQKFITDLRKPRDYYAYGRFYKALPEMKVTDIHESDTYEALPAVNLWPMR